MKPLSLAVLLCVAASLHAADDFVRRAPGLSRATFQVQRSEREAIAPQRFIPARPLGKDKVAPVGFAFEANGWMCTLSSEGVGKCMAPAKTWRFAIPVGDGTIENAFVSTGDAMIFALELTDEESDWGSLVRITAGSRKPDWQVHIRGLDMTTPVLFRGAVLVAALDFTGSFDAATGDANWRHEYLYDGSGRTESQLEVVGNDLVVKTFDIEKPDDVVVIRYHLSDGRPVACEPQP